jgi:uncharacterized protein
MVSLFGGEPLQKYTYDSVEYTLDKSMRKGVFVNIVTNGLELREYVKLLKKYKDNITIQVTVDGIEKIHNRNRLTMDGRNSYESVMEGIQSCLTAGLNVTLRVNVTEESSRFLKLFILEEPVKGWMLHKNFKVSLAPVTNHLGEGGSEIYRESNILKSILYYFPEIIELLSERLEIAPDMFRITGYIKNILSKDRFKYHINPAVFFCETCNLATYAVGADNAVYLCPETVGKEEFKAGSFYPVLNLKEEFINQFRNRNIKNINGCLDCNIAAFCGGGCPMASYKKNGHAKTPFCGNAKEVINQYLQHVSLD